MPVTRRHFLKSAAAFTVGFHGLQRHVAWAAEGLVPERFGYGRLFSDPHRILDLPEGFSYRVLSRTGDAMDDGLPVPGAPDAMAAFAGSNGRTILVCNHELGRNYDECSDPGLENFQLKKLPEEAFYDLAHGHPPMGGTSTIVLNAAGEREHHYMSLAGTVRNCAGGPTPWGSWITCEETTQKAGDGHEKDHGYNFEVPARARTYRAAPLPLREMGRFSHEAVAVDPRSGIVYQTEDTGDSLIYRYIPHRPARLAEGGKLQALVVTDRPGLDTRNWEEQSVQQGERLSVRWIDIENVESPDNDLRYQGHSKGAAIFARGEGMWYGREAVYFACTNGGAKKKGQIWRYMPSAREGMSDESSAPGTLELFIESNDADLLENADNVTVTPWGDLILCEDGPGKQFLVGVTPEGELYKFGHNAYNGSEFAGATFSADGRTLYVNIQSPGITLAITGPWQSQNG